MNGRRRSRPVKKSFARRIYPLVLIVGVVFSIYFMSVFIEQSYSMADLNKQIELKQNEVKELNKEISSLEAELEIADTPEFIEKVAREKLKMVGPRDIIYQDEDRQDEGE
ncbi:MAG: septum formation initiator family protein [Tissierellia bacterium]|nr:septum formation initiator family protein [Tissierellia bacterium]